MVKCYTIVFGENPINNFGFEFLSIVDIWGNINIEFVNNINLGYLDQYHKVLIGDTKEITAERYFNKVLETYSDIILYGNVSGATVKIWLDANDDNFTYSATFGVGVNISDENIPFTVTHELIGIDCENVFLRIKSNYDLTNISYTANGVTTSYTVNPVSKTYDLIVERNNTEQSFTYVCTNTDNINSSNGGTIPPKLQSSQFSITSSIYGTFRYLIVNNENLGELLFNFFGNNFQNENYYPIFANGSYYVLVRDALNCQISLNIEINDYVDNGNYIHIPKSNSIRYKLNQTFDSCSVYKNDDNTLSCESLNLIKYKEIQLFNLCDILKTQFRSNFNIIKAYCNETELDVVKITNNIGNYIKLDCNIINQNNYSYISFNTGNIYNNSNEIVGNHELNGELPEFVEVGGYVFVNNVLLEVLAILYDDINNSYSIKTEQIDINNNNLFSYFYNKENYEVYEFSVEPVYYINEDGYLRVTINNGEYEHISELISIKKEHKNTLFIEYWNGFNTDFIYNGWKHKLRVLFQEIIMNNNSSSDNYKGDNNSVLYKNTNYDINTFKFEPLTRELAYKLNLALSHKFVSINGVMYIKSDEIEIEKIGNDVNLYVVTAKMLKSDNVITIINNDLEQFENGLIENDINGIIINS